MRWPHGCEQSEGEGRYNRSAAASGRGGRTSSSASPVAASSRSTAPEAASIRRRGHVGVIPSGGRVSGRGPAGAQRSGTGPALHPCGSWRVSELRPRTAPGNQVGRRSRARPPDPGRPAPVAALGGDGEAILGVQSRSAPQLRQEEPGGIGGGQRRHAQKPHGSGQPGSVAAAGPPRRAAPGRLRRAARSAPRRAARPAAATQQEGRPGGRKASAWP